jgi:hypothetical protein
MNGTCPCGGQLKENTHKRIDGTVVERTTCTGCGRTEVKFYPVTQKSQSLL